MTLQAAAVRVSPTYGGDGANTAFPFTFKTFAKEELRFVITTAAGVQSDAVLDADFSVTLNADQENTPGGTVAYPISGSPLPIGDTAFVASNIPITQPLDLPNGGRYNAEGTERALDRLTMLIQQVRDLFRGVLRVPETTELLPLPARALRASRTLGFDSDGEPTVLTPVAGSAASVLTDLAATSSVSQGAGLVGNSVQCVDTRTKLKAVNYARNPIVMLTEAGRQWEWRWTLGNYAARVAADTAEGAFIASNLVSSATGAWVCAHPYDMWDARAFGMPVSGSVDCAPAWNAMMAAAVVAKPRAIVLPTAILRADSALAMPTTFQLWLKGAGAGGQQTIIQKNYVEASATRGVVACSAYGAVVEDVAFAAAGGSSGGSGLSFVLPADAPNIGQLHLRNVSVSMGNGANRDIYVDGSAAVSPPITYRQVFFESLTLFGGTGGAARVALELNCVSHVFGTNCFFQDTTRIVGTVGTPSDDIQLTGVFAGGTALEFGTSTPTSYITRVAIKGTVTGAITNQSVNTSWVFINAQVNGLVSRNWNVQTCGIAQPAGALRQYTMSLADAGIGNFTSQSAITGLLVLVDSDGNVGMFNLRGGVAAAVAVIADPQSAYSAASGTAGRTNVYWNGAGYYGIQNLRGATKVYAVEIIGSYGTIT